MGQTHTALSAGRRVLTVVAAGAALAVAWLPVSATAARADGPTGPVADVTGAVGPVAASVTGPVAPVVDRVTDAGRRATDLVRATTDRVPSATVHRVGHTTADTTDRVLDVLGGPTPSGRPSSPGGPGPGVAPGPAGSAPRAASSGAHAQQRPPSGPRVLTVQVALREALPPGVAPAPEGSPPRVGVALALGAATPFAAVDPPTRPSGPVHLGPVSPWLAALVAGLLLMAFLRVQPRRAGRGRLLLDPFPSRPGSTPG